MVLGVLDSMGRYCAPTGKSKCAKILLTKAPRSSWRLPEASGASRRLREAKKGVRDGPQKFESIANDTKRSRNQRNGLKLCMYGATAILDPPGGPREPKGAPALGLQAGPYAVGTAPKAHVTLV